MSSLWTPGGEVPVDRDRPDQAAGTGSTRGAPEPATAERGEPDDAALREQYEQMQRQVLEAPAADVVAQHAATLYELAALHLAQDAPRLAEIRLLIDALDALLDRLRGRLGDAEQPLAAALPQLKVAFVEATDRVAQHDH